MNLTHLHQICKIYGNESYQDALHSYRNAPVGLNPSIEGVISFEVAQSFGCKVNKKFTRDFKPTIEQWRIISETINNYKVTLVKKLYETLNKKPPQ